MQQQRVEAGAPAAFQRRDVVEPHEGEHMARADVGGALGDQRHRGRHDAEAAPGRRYAAMRTFAGPAAARPMRRACG